MPYIDGWEFPMEWNDPDYDDNGREQGVPKMGELYLEYSQGSVPDDSSRRTQFAKCLVGTKAHW